MREVPRNDIVKLTKFDKISAAIDGIISIFSPLTAYKRKAFRYASNMLAATGYKGARTHRLRSSWVTSDGSADEEILADLPALRARSRDLNRNDAHASGITNTIVSNDIGIGIKPQSKISNFKLNITDEQVEILQNEAEYVWERWTPFASADNKLDFYEVQALCDRQLLESGEFIAVPTMIKDNRRPYQFALQIVESDRLMTPSDLTSNKKIRSGVETGSRGEPIAYWIRKEHPGDVTIGVGPRTNDSKNFIRYPAYNALGRPNIFHLFFTERPGQSRGVPFFAPVLNYFKDVADYMEAELVAARIAACFAIFITKTDPAGAASAMTAKTNSAGQRIEEMEPGIIEYLRAGEKIEAFNPNRPGGTFDPFINRMLRAISAALGLSYELVSKDFSKTNFSSARASLLETRRYFKMRQEWLARKLCQPVWNMVLEEAYLNGDFKVKDFFKYKHDYCRVRWIAPGWQWVDPAKEGEAAKLAIQNGLTTFADECAAQGKDWDDVIGQRAREAVKIKQVEEKYQVKLGIMEEKTPEAKPEDNKENEEPVEEAVEE